MKKILTGCLIASVLMVGSPAYAADNSFRGLLSEFADSFSEFINAATAYLGIEEISKNHLLQASVIVEEKSKGRVFGPFDDAVTPPDGNGVFEGEVNIIVGEDLENGVFDNFYYLHDKITGIVVEMKPDGKLPPGLEAGAMLRVVGRVQGGEIKITADAAEGKIGSVEVLEPAAVEVAAAATTRSVLGIVINTSDANAACSAPTFLNKMQNTLGDNVADAFLSASHGELTFVAEATGPYTVNNLATDSYSTIGAAGRAAAQAAGVDLSAYDHIMHIIPDNPSNGYAGYGSYAGPYTWLYSCVNDVFQHELGHNLNLGHANRDGQEYNDRGSFMGYGGVGLRHANASHMNYLNWLPAAAILENPGPGTYTISSSDMYPGDVTYPQAIKLSKADTNSYYYISFRTPTGYANKMPSIYDYTTQIHTAGVSSRTGTDFKFLSGSTPFIDTANGLEIRQVGSSTQTGVTIEIGTVCTTNAPTVNITPNEVGSTPGGTAQYTVNVKNNNSAYCGNSSFNLSSVDNSANLTTVLSSNSLSIASGASTNVTLSATSDTSIGGGSVTLTVSATTPGSSNGASDTALYTIDASAPTAPSNVKASVSKSQINITWNSSSDNVAVAGYNIYRGSGQIGTTQTTSFADRYPVSGTNTYTVEAFDAAGNVSTMSSSASADFSKGGGKGGRASR